MHKVRAVARRSHGDLNERRVDAVGSQRRRSNSAVRSPRAPRGRRAHAAGTHMIAARTPPYTTIICECNEWTKNWQIPEFQFPKPYFQPFCSVKNRNQAITTYFSVAECLRCLLHHILSLIAYTFRENRDFVFITIVQFMMNSNIRLRFGSQILFVCLYITPSHYHHCVNLSEDIELIKRLSDIFCRVCEWD